MKENSSFVTGGRYDALFKEEVLQMIRNGRPVSEVARSLGIGNKHYYPPEKPQPCRRATAGYRC